MEEQDVVLTAEDVADRWSVNRLTVYSLCQGPNPLPHFRVKKLYRFRLSEIKDYEDKHMARR